MLASGTRLGPYEIVALIGAGGMGEVFKARDTRLERSVAIKILPAAFREDAQLKIRFEREARTISQLNHPHICTLYDIGHDNGTDYLVLEYLEGQSLADCLTRGPLPLEQVLRYGTQIAEALDRAHKAGIVHRDLKPGNVMITKSGAKLLDFGLAKSGAAVISPVLSGATAGATEHKPLTAEGTIIGTLQYMAPEQLEGQAADARTDIFAFGTLLYEMVTGKRAFDGKTKTSLIAAIVDREPPSISSLQPLTPPAFERLVKVCMAKDPDERWQTAHDVLLQLRWIAEGGSQAGLAAPVVRRRKHREWTAWAVSALLVASTATFAWLWRRATAEPPRRVELSILPPAETVLNFDFAQPAISPDGDRVVFPARGTDGKTHLWQRRLDNAALHKMPGTEGGGFPFWSPDSRFIGFFSEGKLRTIDAAGGPARVIADAKAGRGGSWASDGTILFAPTAQAAIHRVRATGGVPVAVSKLEKGELSHRFPWFLPDGRHFLYLAQGAANTGRIVAGSVDTLIKKPLLDTNSFAAFSPPGFILYLRDGALVAHPFSAGKLELGAGDSILLAGDVRANLRIANAVFSVSPSGVLTYQAGSTGQISQLTVMDRGGKEVRTIGTPADYQRPGLSHDGRKVAVEVADADGITDLWIHDLVRKTASRFTFDEASETHAVWSPDDRWIAYASEVTTGGARQLRRSPSNGTGAAESLWDTPGSGLGVTDWSSDGALIFYHSSDGQGGSLDGGSFSIEQKKAMPAIQSRFMDATPRLSPDGRWLAYSTNESGRAEVMVQTFPRPAGRWQISTDGGSQPRWRRDGKELFYVSADNKIMAVPIQAGESFDAGTPKPLFAIREKASAGWPYDVSGDGQTFIVNQPVAAKSDEPLTVVLNWTAGLPK